MSDRTRGFIVTLDHEMRVDDAEDSVIAAIRMLRGVSSVEPIVTGVQFQLAETAARDKLRDRIRDILWPPARLPKTP